MPLLQINLFLLPGRGVPEVAGSPGPLVGLLTQSTTFFHLVPFLILLAFVFLFAEFLIVCLFGRCATFYCTVCVIEFLKGRSVIQLHTITFQKVLAINTFRWLANFEIPHGSFKVPPCMYYLSVRALKAGWYSKELVLPSLMEPLGRLRPSVFSKLSLYCTMCL
jgi:hypothetical protein